MKPELYCQELASALSNALTGFEPVNSVGRVTDAVGTVLRISGLRTMVGQLCMLRVPETGRECLGEVVGFSGTQTMVTPLGGLEGFSRGTEVYPTELTHRVMVGDALLGRVLNGFGEPIDGEGPVANAERVPVSAMPPHPLERPPVKQFLGTGVRAIDALLSVGEGQRVGIFAAAGVGKSTLMGMLAKGTSADVNVIALVGERGREVREFIEHNLGEEGRRRSVVVVATSDRPAMERVKCAMVATSIAEYFRARGKKVMLLLDSVTRFARAQREIGLAAGEPPTRRGYPPSLFALLPQLLERAGNDGNGSITAFYTVLTEGEDLADPVAEEVRSILDGHIVLSQKIAAQGRFPAIDVLQSKSRLMSAVAERPHQAAARKFISLLAKYQEIEFLIQVGEFKRGEDALADEAASKIERLRAFLAQEPDRVEPFNDTRINLLRLADTT
ncbi:MAG TPA: FliI/YscN family ATPase [Noviherbaspirillum sp.]|nr:FliI/YscN family ATPase [Noviherbaspirillum sp.]